MARYLAIDIGASSGRHISAEIRDGILVTEEIYRFPNGAMEEGGRLFWDAEALFAEIVAGLKKAGEIGKAPDCVGIDTWAVDYVLVDKDGRPGKVFCYRDARGGLMKEKAHSLMPFSELYARTGIQYQPFNTLYQLLDDKERGALAGAESLLMLPDYFNWRLTGVMRQEYTNATSTGMVNARTHTWDEDILRAFGYPEKLFGELTQPGSAVGRFSPEMEEKIGYSATVMLPATHDTASAVLAAPAEDGQPYISSGTWSLLGIERPEAICKKEALLYNYSNEGSVDFRFRFQKNIMGLWMIQQARKEWGSVHSFGELADMARACPHDRTVDVNDGSFLAPESMLDAIYAKAGRMGIGETAYCIFNSLAECNARSLAELERLTGKTYDTLHIIGGGCKNGLLNELTAQKTGKKVTAGPVEGTAIGNIIMQAIGTGEIGSLAEARKMTERSFDITEVRI